MKIKDKVRSAILSRTTEKGNQKIGIELETIIHTNNYNRLPVDEEGTFSSVDLLRLFNDKQNDNGSYSLEPGGQLEWASPPFVDLNDLQSSLELFCNQLDLVLNSKKLTLINYALDPKFSPDEVGLINEKKYQLMDKYMSQSGSMGKWMMRNTASIQINLDTTGPENMEVIAFIADCINPIASYLFSNSPFKNKKPAFEKNLRNIIWANTDNLRCNNLFDQGIYLKTDLVDEYINFFLGIPAIFSLDRKGRTIATKRTIGDLLLEEKNNGILSKNRILTFLRQVFTNVRIKNLVEIRGADRTPEGFEIAPAAFWTGLLMDKSIRKTTLNTVSSWEKEDRALLNNAGFSLNTSQKGPSNKTYGYWIDYFGQLALNGLKKRKLGEEKLFNVFFEAIKKDGPFSLQSQNRE